MEEQKKRILLADDHRVLRTGLKLLLGSQPDFSVVAEASDGMEVLEALTEIPADIVLLDLSMPTMNGLDCLTRIREEHPGVKVVVLTMHADTAYIQKCMKSGASGYLCKDAIDTDLFTAIRTVARGERYLGAREAHALIDGLMDVQENELSAREREVLELLAHGYSLTGIAEKLYLSVKTVSTYKTRLMQKLGCQSKAELVDYALRHKIL